MVPDADNKYPAGVASDQIGVTGGLGEELDEGNTGKGELEEKEEEEEEGTEEEEEVKGMTNEDLMPNGNSHILR